MVTLHTREKQPFSNRLCLSTLQFFFWQGIDKAIELRQISFVELTLRNCRTEQQMMTAGVAEMWLCSVPRETQNRHT